MVRPKKGLRPAKILKGQKGFHVFIEFSLNLQIWEWSDMTHICSNIAN